MKRRKNSLRKKNHNYAANGFYFITFVTKERKEILSTIDFDSSNPTYGAKVSLTPIGRILEEEWAKTFEMRQYIQPIAHVIMPDHFHAVFCIHAGERHKFEKAKQTIKGKTVSSIIGNFKAAVSRRVNQEAGFDRDIWARQFHDSIIRDLKHLQNVIQYIKANPSKYLKNFTNPQWPGFRPKEAV